MLDDKQINSIDGWGKWADMVIKTIATIESQLNQLQGDLKNSLTSINKELDSNKDNIHEVEITLEELKRVSDKIAVLQDAIKILPSISKEVEVLKTINIDFKEITIIKSDIAVLKEKIGRITMFFGTVSVILTALASVLLYFMKHGAK